MTFCPQAVVWGSVAEWVGGVGTSIAAFIAVGSLLWQLRTRNERREQDRRAQARLVYISEVKFDGYQHDGDKRWPRVSCKITNGSAEVITDLICMFEVWPEMPRSEKKRKLPVLRSEWFENRIYPGETVVVDVRLDEPLPDDIAEGEVKYVRRMVLFMFSDGAGARWARDWDHRLVSNEESDTILIHSDATKRVRLSRTDGWGSGEQ